MSGYLHKPMMHNMYICTDCTLLTSYTDIPPSLLVQTTDSSLLALDSPSNGGSFRPLKHTTSSNSMNANDIKWTCTCTYFGLQFTRDPRGMQTQVSFIKWALIRIVKGTPSSSSSPSTKGLYLVSHVLLQWTWWKKKTVYHLWGVVREPPNKQLLGTLVGWT